MRMWQWAKDYTLADNFFMGAFGGSYLNHQWLVCACTPVFTDAPAAMRAQLDEQRQAEEAARLARLGHGRPGAALRRRGHAGRLRRSTRRSRRTSRAACRRGRRNVDLADATARTCALPCRPDAEDDRRHASAKGVSWAWYARRLERSALADGRRPPRAKRTVDLHTATRAARCSSRTTSRSTTHARFGAGRCGLASGT